MNYVHSSEQKVDYTDTEANGCIDMVLQSDKTQSAGILTVLIFHKM